MMRVFSTALLLISVSVVGNPVLGQEVAPDAAKKGAGKSQAGAMLDAEAAAVMKPAGRLPRYFSSLVTPEQRLEIYQIQAKFMERTQQLEAQLAALKMEEQAAFEAVLNDAQREQLLSLREAAMTRAKEMRAARTTSVRGRTTTSTNTTVNSADMEQPAQAETTESSKSTKSTK